MWNDAEIGLSFKNRIKFWIVVMVWILDGVGMGMGAGFGGVGVGGVGVGGVGVG